MVSDPRRRGSRLLGRVVRVWQAKEKHRAMAISPGGYPRRRPRRDSRDRAYTATHGQGGTPSPRRPEAPGRADEQARARASSSDRHGRRGTSRPRNARQGSTGQDNARLPPAVNVTLNVAVAAVQVPGDPLQVVRGWGNCERSARKPSNC